MDLILIEELRPRHKPVAEALAGQIDRVSGIEYATGEVHPEDHNPLHSTNAGVGDLALDGNGFGANRAGKSNLALRHAQSFSRSPRRR